MAFCLRVFFTSVSFRETKQGYSCQFWNRWEVWRYLYPQLRGVTFFAEDIFGEQFGLSETKIVRFNPETGELTDMSSSMEEWAESILAKYDVELGYNLAHDWQKIHGTLSVNQRLLPKLFFTVGGEFKLDNLYALDAVEGMRLRADFCHQIEGLPDKTMALLKIV